MVMSLDAAFGILGVSPDSTEAQIKTAYKKLALRNHPDKVLFYCLFLFLFEQYFADAETLALITSPCKRRFHVLI